MRHKQQMPLNISEKQREILHKLAKPYVEVWILQVSPGKLADIALIFGESVCDVYSPDGFRIESYHAYDTRTARIRAHWRKLSELERFNERLGYEIDAARRERMRLVNIRKQEGSDIDFGLAGA